MAAGANSRRRAQRRRRHRCLLQPQLAAADEPVNQAEAYEVRVVTAPDEGKVAPGEKYWRLVYVRHRTPEENQGKHNAYVTAIDENGQRVHDDALRIGWTWEGRQGRRAG